mgnify:CR=1 FL=1
MRWEDERYVRIYIRDTPDWLAMQWQGRAVFYELARKVDRAGFIGVGKSGIRGLAGCLHMPVEVVEVGIEDLITDGCVQRVEGGYLIRNFLEAQETPQSDKARKRNQRERDRDSKRATAGGAEPSREVTDGHEVTEAVTKRDGESQNVTESHAASRGVTPGHAASLCTVPCRAVPSSTEISPPPAGARAHEDKPTPPTFSSSETPPSGHGVVLADAESLLAAVGRHEMLRALHGDRRWATNASTGFMGGAVRAADVDAAINAFVTREASRAPDFDDALDRFVRDRIGGYLTKARQYGDEARARARREAERDQRGRPAPPHSPDAQAALEVFGTVWATKKRRSFVPAAGDDRHAADLAERARAAAPLGTWLDVVRFWAERHLASQDRFVVDSDHALRTLGSQLTSYGLPKTPAAKQSLRLHEEPVVGAPMPAGMLDAIGAQGPREGAVMRRPGGPS